MAHTVKTKDVKSIGSYVVMAGAVFIFIMFVVNLIPIKKTEPELEKISSEWALRKGSGTKDNVFKLRVGVPITTIRPKPNTEYRVFSLKPFYAIDGQGVKVWRNKGCSYARGGEKYGGYFSFEGIEPDTEIKIEEGSCRDVKS